MSVGLLDFFVLEASDYVDRLQRLVATDEAQGPDAATLLKLARGLRGSAVMARLTSFAAAASGVERGALLLHEGSIAWTPELASVISEASAELRALIPMARLWGESQDQRARSAGGRLNAVLDAAERRGKLMQSGAAAEAAADVPVAAPPNRAVSAFFDSVDRSAAAPDILSPTGAAASPTPVPLPSVRSASVSTPFGGVAAVSDTQLPIVPIASLAPNGSVDAVVFRAPNPAITFAQRFIADVSPLVGSLRARLAPLRQGATEEASADVVVAFRPVLLSLRDTAASYGYADVREFCNAMLAARAPLSADAAGALDTALTVVLQQNVAPQVRAQRLAELRRVAGAATPLSAGARSAPSSALGVLPMSRNRTPLGAARIGTPTPAVTPSVSRPTPAAPSGRELSSLLSQSLEKVQDLTATPLDLIAIPSPPMPPASIGPDGEPDVIPIDALLYRGPRALARARLIVGQLRVAGETHDPALVSELLDLVELAGSAS